MRSPLLAPDDRGLACTLGGFHVDPWKPVPLAVITHAHSDHARPGHGRYICAAPGLALLERRIGPASIQPVKYGERFKLGDVTVSLHPAGHVLGSAQIRIESADEVWVVSGDYKRAADPSCASFEVVPCDLFITEATFALPIYRWDPPTDLARQILDWWDHNRAREVPSVLFGYALGKTQRILAELWLLVDAERRARPVFTHGTAEALMDPYRRAGIPMMLTEHVADAPAGKRGDAARFKGELIVAPPSAAGSPWMRRFGPDADTAFASGWMRVRGVRRRRGYDRGFALSDHADWSELLRTIQETRAKRVLATHGSSAVLARFLREQGLEAGELRTSYEGEDED